MKRTYHVEEEIKLDKEIIDVIGKLAVALIVGVVTRNPTTILEMFKK